MIIPKRYQVFDKDIRLTQKDADRLTPHLSGWPHLHELFLLDVFNEPDLQRLVIIELLGQQRKMMIDRILMRLGRIQRKQVHARVQKLLRCSNQKSKRKS